ncbi:response regulator transcription factor [Streptomyces sp. NPDC058953]|uniref:response regulator transcription factor n=1 Tax=unclassified Streptomyces TaxID=2593676 RepID=UPI0036B9BCB1
MIQSFTDQELTVFELLAHAPSNDEIAERLYISERTVKFHIANLRRKLGGVSRHQICLIAALHLLLDRPHRDAA